MLDTSGPGPATYATMRLTGRAGNSRSAYPCMDVVMQPDNVAAAKAARAARSKNIGSPPWPAGAARYPSTENSKWQLRYRQLGATNLKIRLTGATSVARAVAAPAHLDLIALGHWTSAQTRI